MKRKHDTITLSPAEKLLREVLLECRGSISDPAASKLEMWFTGGWVRDKLLGIQSPDIDATLSKMTGVQLGWALEDFLDRHGDRYRKEAENMGLPYDFRGVHKTLRNPEKSKHLETAIIHIFGLDVDLVNLRKETYAQDSRNPQIEFGTAEEDALRRDATVNALYYNLDKQQVEDFTTSGLEDMAAGIIRTPLDPHQTFMDDPLRVLRLIRFSAQFGYTIEDRVRRSMSDDLVHTALNQKISRERVGIEVTKMMNGRNPPFAFQLIYEMNLYSTVFLDPTAGTVREAMEGLLPDQEAGRPWPSTWPRSYRGFATLLERDSVLKRELIDPEERESLWLTVAYTPMAELRHIKLEEAVKAMTEAVKATNKATKLIRNSLTNMDDIQSKVDLVARRQSPDLRRSTLGMAIRSWGATWKLQVLYSLLAEVVYNASNNEFFWSCVERYSALMEYVVDQNLREAHTIKPIVDGNDIKTIFELKKTGSFVKDTLDGIVEWQFDHPDGTKDEAVTWLRTQKERFGVP